MVLHLISSVIHRLSYGKVNQPCEMDFTLQELSIFSYAVKTPSFHEVLLTPVEGARASMSLPGSHPDWLNMASYFRLHVGKSLEMEALK